MQSTYNHKALNKLIDKIKKGNPQTKKELIDLHKKLLIAVASTHKKTSKLPIDELVKAANIGLIQAALNFQESKGFTFITYAVWWINKSILEKTA